MCELDLEYAQVYVRDIRRARKAHRCSSCRATIQPGEVYEKHASLYDGSWDSAKVCFVCWWILTDFGEHHRSWPFPSALHETLTECYRYGEEGRARWKMYARVIERRSAA